MNLRIALLGATALTVLTASGALAGSNNESYITQSGGSNSASVTQSAGNNNDAGRTGDYMSQNGSNNVLKIVQDGDSGSIGVINRTDPYNTPGHSPQYTITFQGVDQNSSGSGSNSADLTQHGMSNTIGDLQQTALSTAGGNQATTVQSGSGNYITHLWQEQVAGAAATNVANITESGTGNVIDRVDQKAQGTGSANQIIANISGTNNGKDDLTGVGGFYASRGFAAGATPSALIQNNYGGTLYGAAYAGNISDNYINLQVSGADNKFGLTQKGYSNSAGTLTITGSNNMFGSYQEGYSNVISAGAIAGSGNDIGIWQSGGANTAHVSVLAFGNDYNQLSIGQSGYNNDASVDITGSNNGAGSFGSNVAGALVLTNTHLSNGSLWQDNSSSSSSLGNHASYTVFGDSNDFALAQIGDQNHITGTVGSSGSSSGSGG